MSYKTTYRRPAWADGITQATIKESGGSIFYRRPVNEDLLMIYTHTHTARRNGYLPKDVYGTVPYYGKFGRGFILFEHLNGQQVECTYYTVPYNAAETEDI